MKDREKTKEQLRGEITKLSQQVCTFNVLEAVAKQAEDVLLEKNSYLRLLQVATAAANEALKIEDALQPILKEICRYKGWPIGHVYLISKEDPDLLKSTKYWWFKDPKRFDSFRSITEMTNFVRGIGLPGRVLGSGWPHWIVDVTRDKDFVRANVAREVDVKSAFAFPIMIGTKVAGVLEFFSTVEEGPDQQFLDIMANVGTQLGRAIERKWAEEKLRRTATLLFKVLNSTPDLIFAKDMDLRTIVCNKAYASAVGKKPEEMIGKTDIENGWNHELVRGNPAKGIRGFENDDRQALSGREVHNPSDPANVGNEIRIFDTRKLPLRDENGKIFGVLGVSRDITESKRIEEEKQELQLKMLATSKLASLGEIATGIAHEINQPLTYISSFNQRLKESLDDNVIDKGLLKEELRTSHTQVNRIVKIIDHLRTFGRRDDIEKEQVAIETVFNNTMLLIGERVRLRNIKMIKNIDPNIPLISGSPNQLEQIFINLFQNAIDAFPEKPKYGEIRVDISLSENKKSVIIKVADNGIGIEKEECNKIFEPFFTTKEIGKGTGLGLSIVYGIVQEHNGTIMCESRPNKGATFTISLPVNTYYQGKK